MENTLTATKESFTYNFKTSKTPEEVYRSLLDIEQWWSGLHGETIKGTSQKVGDEFTFEAGKGAHFSRQKLIELVPNKRVVWLVKDSKLTFLSDTSEWTNTKICFDISTEGKETKVTFMHDGLLPEVECYNDCSTVWPKYLQRFKENLSRS